MLSCFPVAVVSVINRLGCSSFQRFFTIVSLALGQPYEYHSTSQVTFEIKCMICLYQTTWKHKKARIVCVWESTCNNVLALSRFAVCCFGFAIIFCWTLAMHYLILHSVANTNAVKSSWRIWKENRSLAVMYYGSSRIYATEISYHSNRDNLRKIMI